MERVKQILLDKGKAVADSAIEAKLSEYGIEGEPSDADAKAIAEELESQAQSVTNGLSVSDSNSKPSVPAKGKGRGRKSAKQVTLEKAILHAAKETETELSTMEGAIRQHKGKYVEARTKSIVNEIRNTSAEIVESVTSKLMEETADAESFHQIGNAFGENLFPSFTEFEA